jgi:hypothetical protein
VKSTTQFVPKCFARDEQRWLERKKRLDANTSRASD